jgi:hypothetical protein
MTMSADGKSATGTATDSDGRKFTITATGNGKPATSDALPVGLPQEVAQGPRRRPILRMFEVSHFALDNGDLVRTPSVLLSLQADDLPGPETLIVTGAQGYDPLAWLT